MVAGIKAIVFRSRPARARGLKPFLQEGYRLHYVAPRAGAWIETPTGNYMTYDSGRAPRGRVD